MTTHDTRALHLGTVLRNRGEIRPDSTDLLKGVLEMPVSDEEIEFRQCQVIDLHF